MTVNARIIVYGGRTLDAEACYEWLRVNLYAELARVFGKPVSRIALLAHGDADGADRGGKLYAERHLPLAVHKPVTAQWERYGRHRAGPIRNRELFQLAQPNVVVEFPGKDGTADMRSIIDDCNSVLARNGAELVKIIEAKL